MLCQVHDIRYPICLSTSCFREWAMLCRGSRARLSSVSRMMLSVCLRANRNASWNVGAANEYI